MSDPITINGKTVEICELTVNQQREWLKGRSEREDKAMVNGFDPVDWFLFEETSLWDIAFVTNLTEDDLGEARPSEIDGVVEKMREVNPHFFAMRARVKSMTENLKKSLPPDKPSTP